MISRALPVFLAIVSGVSAADIKVIEQIVAKVNGDIITKGELERSRQSLEAELRQQKVPEEKMQALLNERQADALKDQIDQLLLVQKSKELNINVDAEITRELADIQLQNKITDPDKFRAWVQEQSGMSYEDLKQQMKNRALTQRVIRQEIGGRITIPKTELHKYYDEHKNDFIRQEQVFLREIFISAVGKTPEQLAAAEKRAKDTLARAKKGEKFPELARDTSDAESAKNLGEIGWFKKSDLNPSLQFLFKEKKGFITDVIKTENGFVIFRLDERHEAGLAPFEEVENEVTEKLYVPRMQPKVKEYLTKLREVAFLEIREGYVDSGAAPGKDTSWRDPAQLKPETTTKEEVAARRRKRFLGIIPRKSVNVKADTGSNPAPAETTKTPPPAPPVPAGAPIPTRP